jgi:hypothetical protein
MLFISDPDLDPDPDSDFLPTRIPDPGVKKIPDPGSESATLSTSIYCFIFLVSIKDRCHIFKTCILDNILKFSGSLALHLVEMDTDPDPDPNQQALDADPDPQHWDPI